MGLTGLSLGFAFSKTTSLTELPYMEARPSNNTHLLSNQRFSQPQKNIKTRLARKQPYRELVKRIIRSINGSSVGCTI